MPIDLAPALTGHLLTGHALRVAPLVTDSEVMHLALQVMVVSLKLAAPILVTSLAIGFVISLFQSVTHIQEPTLSFVPKVVGVGIVLLLSGNWMMHTMISFTQHLFDQVPTLLG